MILFFGLTRIVVGILFSFFLFSFKNPSRNFIRCCVMPTSDLMLDSEYSFQLVSCALKFETNKAITLDFETENTHFERLHFIF